MFAFDPAFDSIPGENGMHLELCEKFPGNDVEQARIIWINGPYGVGKSTLAAYLHRCHPNSFVFDAEAVGNLVRDHRPDPMYNGAVFEDYPRWFDVCVLLLADMAAGYDGDIYVPMTLIRRDSFSRFAAPLRARGIEVRQVLLVSDRKVVHDRILARGEDEGCWCMQQIDLCLACQADMDDAVRIRSDGASVEELGAEVERFLR